MYANRNLTNPVFIAIAVLLMVSLACGSSTAVSTQPASTGGQGQSTNSSEPTDAQGQAADTPVPTNTLRSTNTSLPPTATQNPNLVKPGTYLVGTDIQPGIYKGDAGDNFLDSCYWERLKDLSGSIDAILANDNSIGQFYIEIRASDYAIETSCELLPLDSLPARIGDFPEEIKPGTYIIGRDIQSGLYKGQAGNDVTASCYWARLSNVAGDFDSIIANDNSVGQFYVQVATSDFALSTACDLQRVGK